MRLVLLAAASTVLLSTKVGKEAWVEPVVEGSQYRFEVQVTDGKRKPPARPAVASNRCSSSLQCSPCSISS